MFLGYVTYDGTEIANAERLNAYAENGLVPVGTEVDACDECEGLGAAVGDSPYTSPLLDNPPWLDPLNPDTYDFAGVLITDITGIDDATGSVSITPTLADGAIAGRRRYGPREMGVTAVLAGRTTEGVEAGLAWLRSVLMRTCAPADPSCGPVAAVEAFTVCPGPICPTPDPTGVLIVSETYDPWSMTPLGSGDWEPGETSEDAGFLTAPDFALDGGTPDLTIDPPLDGGDPDGTGDPALDGGAPDTIYEGGVAYVGHPILAEADGITRVRWTLANNTDDPISVTHYVIDLNTGAILTVGPTFAVPTPKTGYVTEWVIPPGIPEGAYWMPAIGIDVAGPLEVNLLEVLTPELLSPEECIAPYRRVIPAVATIDGPRVTERIAMGDCADWLQVEWVWTSGSPFRYGSSKPLIAGSTWGNADGTFTEQGVTAVSYNGVPADDCSPPVPGLSCADDPCYPGWTSAPALPVIEDPDVITVDGRTTRGVDIRIDGATLPTLDGVLSFLLTADAPKLGVRIRVWRDVTAEWAVADECDPDYGWLIDYIPADGTVTIDGTTGTVTTDCESQLLPAPTPASGMFRGPLPDPAVGCGQRTLIRVEWVTTYPRDCGAVYVEGENQGSISVDVSVRTRES